MKFGTIIAREMGNIEGSSSLLNMVAIFQNGHQWQLFLDKMSYQQWIIRDRSIKFGSYMLKDTKEKNTDMDPSYIFYMVTILQNGCQWQLFLDTFS